MSLATPGRVTALSATGARPAALALLVTGAAAGFGLGLAGLALTAPVPFVAPLPPLDAVTPALGAGPAADAVLTSGEAGQWAPLFGAPPPPAAPLPEREIAPEPEPEFDPLAEFDSDAYVLRGLVVGEDGTDGFALLETAGEVIVVRPGDVLPDGYEVLDITPDGVEIDLFGTPWVIGFVEDAEPLDTDFQDGRRNRVEEGPVRNRPERGSRGSRGDFGSEGDGFAGPDHDGPEFADSADESDDDAYDHMNDDSDDDFTDDDDPDGRSPAPRFGISR